MRSHPRVVCYWVQVDEIIRTELTWRRWLPEADAIAPVLPLLVEPLAVLPPEVEPPAALPPVVLPAPAVPVVEPDVLPPLVAPALLPDVPLLLVEPAAPDADASMPVTST